MTNVEHILQKTDCTLRMSRAIKPYTCLYTFQLLVLLFPSGRGEKEIFKKQGRIRNNIQTSLCTKLRVLQKISIRFAKERLKKEKRALTRGTRIANCWLVLELLMNSTVNYTSRQTYFDTHGTFTSKT